MKHLWTHLSPPPSDRRNIKQQILSVHNKSSTTFSSDRFNADYVPQCTGLELSSFPLGNLEQSRLLRQLAIACLGLFITRTYSDVNFFHSVTIRVKLLINIGLLETTLNWCGCDWAKLLCHCWPSQIYFATSGFLHTWRCWVNWCWRSHVLYGSSARSKSHP